MAERINLEVPATQSAFAIVRMVLGPLCARLDFSIDEIDDVYLATGELLRSALRGEPLERLRVEMLVEDDHLEVCAGSFTSQALRDELKPPEEVADCLDLCLLLRRTVDEFRVEGEDDQYRVTLRKRRCDGAP
jgi:anti-sigma regulatory factor (Ser/Thr protein kinase)